MTNPNAGVFGNVTAVVAGADKMQERMCRLPIGDGSSKKKTAQEPAQAIEGVVVPPQQPLPQGSGSNTLPLQFNITNYGVMHISPASEVGGAQGGLFGDTNGGLDFATGLDGGPDEYTAEESVNELIRRGNKVPEPLQKRAIDPPPPKGKEQTQLGNMLIDSSSSDAKDGDTKGEDTKSDGDSLKGTTQSERDSSDEKGKVKQARDLVANASRRQIIGGGAVLCALIGGVLMFGGDEGDSSLALEDNETIAKAVKNGMAVDLGEMTVAYGTNGSTLLSVEGELGVDGNADGVDGVVASGGVVGALQVEGAKLVCSLPESAITNVEVSDDKVVQATVNITEPDCQVEAQETNNGEGLKSGFSDPDSDGVARVLQSINSKLPEGEPSFTAEDLKIISEVVKKDGKNIGGSIAQRAYEELLSRAVNESAPLTSVAYGGLTEVVEGSLSYIVDENVGLTNGGVKLEITGGDVATIIGNVVDTAKKDLAEKYSGDDSLNGEYGTGRKFTVRIKPASPVGAQPTFYFNKPSNKET